MPPARITSLAALAALGLSCRSGPPPAIDPVLAARVPAGATILAGVNLDRVRASPLFGQFPPAVRAFLEAWNSAHSILAASDGSRYLVLARGDFSAAPAGSTPIAKGLAASGSADWVDAARHGSGRNALLPRAETVAASSDIWMVADGNASLPVTGNAENLNRLLHMTEYATLTVRLTDSAALEVTGACSGAEQASHLEETVRAFAGIGAGAAARQPALAAILRRVRITRDGRAVHVVLTVEAVELPELLKLLGVS